MKKTVLRKYYEKGWLKYGLKNFSAHDRLLVGTLFYEDYMKSHVLSAGVLDVSKPLVDGGLKIGSVETNLVAKDKFMKAYQSIPKEKRWVIEIVIFKDCELKENLIAPKVLKKFLCEALDALIFYYLGKKNGV